MKKVLVVWVVASSLFLSCMPEKPFRTEGMVCYTALVVDTTGWYNPADSCSPSPVAGAEVLLTSQDYQQRYHFFSDENGKVRVSNVLASIYDVHVMFPLDAGLMLTAEDTWEIFDISTAVDTLFLHLSSSAPLVINELYYCGPRTSIPFYFDQYVELFNRSDTTVYLDGMILARVRIAEELIFYLDTLSYVQTSYAFQFPGEPGERNYPLLPGEFVVIATDAYNHSLTVPEALDLSQADFEFYNQYGGDYDNPDVPNLHNMLPNRTPDFLLNQITGAVVLADGRKWKRITIELSYGELDFLNIPVENVLDGVEYKIDPSKPKYLTRRIDRGFTGIGITRHSGKSVERADPYRDTNNSTADFRIRNRPSPGY